MNRAFLRLQVITALGLSLLAVIPVLAVRMSQGEAQEITFEPEKTDGPADAPARILVFSDFSCPYCEKMAGELRAVKAELGDKVSIAYKNFAFAPDDHMATRAALAAHCAGRQNRFWAYHDDLFEHQTDWVGSDKLDALLLEYAEHVQLDTKLFQQCYESREGLPALRQSEREGEGFLVMGTPTLILNGRKIIVANNATGIIESVRAEVPGI